MSKPLLWRAYSCDRISNVHNINWVGNSQFISYTLERHSMRTLYTSFYRDIECTLVLHKLSKYIKLSPSSERRFVKQTNLLFCIPV